MSKIIILDFVKIELFDDYVISTINEGVSFDMEELDKILEVFRVFFEDRPFVSIANRQFDYTINPTCLMQPTELNLLGIAIFCTSESAAETAKFEKTFFNGPFEIFFDLEKCIEWKDAIINAYKKGATTTVLEKKADL